MTYSNSLAMGRQNIFTPSQQRSGTKFSGRNQNAVTFRSRDRRLGPVSNTVVLIVLALVLGFMYLTQVTKTNAEGYRINDLQQQQTQLKAEHDDLQVASARLESVGRIQSSDQAKQLVAVTPSGTVAQ